MPRTVRAHQYDTVDRICHRLYGRTAGVTSSCCSSIPASPNSGRCYLRAR